MPLVLDVKNNTHSPVPKINWGFFAKRALSSNYELSIVICGDKLARRLNKEYRGKNYCPNVLSFPINSLKGEIFLNLRQSAREARSYGRSIQEHNLALYVHALAHLAGHDHGEKMDMFEKKISKK